MIAGIIVFGSIAFAVVLAVIYVVRRDVRVWLEAPKLDFQAHVERYDQAIVDNPTSETR